MPWALQVYPAGSNDFLGAVAQRGLLPWVLALLVLVWGVGAYFIWRAVSREIRVARLQTDFVSAVSHEFRSPLSTLGQISEMLTTDRFPSEDLRRKSYTVLVRETERLRGLVEGLLDFGRLEAGQATYHFESIELGSFLESLVAEFEDRVSVSGYHIELSRPSEDIAARADRDALSRAVSNLLDNAVKYSPECYTVWVDVKRTGSRIAIAIRDRGLGIPAGEQHQIFERFVRGTNSSGRRIKGTGIGLAMVRHIMHAHGGEIVLVSEPGKGSCFTMTLPEQSA